MDQTNAQPQAPPNSLLPAESCEQPPVDDRPVLAAGLRQVALAASLATLAPGPLLEELADELGMLWPTRIQPALLRAQQYLPLWTDRCDIASLSYSKCMLLGVALTSQMLLPLSLVSCIQSALLRAQQSLPLLN